MIRGYMPERICLGTKAYANHIIYVERDGIIKNISPFVSEEEGIVLCPGIAVILSHNTTEEIEKIKAKFDIELRNVPKENRIEIILNSKTYKEFSAIDAKGSLFVIVN